MKRIPRSTYIGGPHAATLMGKHPFSSYAESWQEIKFNKRKDLSGQPQIKRGHMAEKTLLDEIDREYGGTMARDVFLLDPLLPFIGGTADGIYGPKGMLIEATTCLQRSAHYWGEDGSGDPAIHKWIQAQHYLGILSRPEVVDEIGAEIPNARIDLWIVDSDEWRRYEFKREQAFIDSLRETCEKFWFDHIIGDARPDPDEWTASKVKLSEDALKILYEKEDGSSTEPTPRLIEAAKEYSEQRAAEKEAGERKSAAATIIKSELRDSGKCVFDGGRVSWTSRNLKPKTDWKQVAQDLAEEFGEKEALDRLVEENTTSGQSSRMLRVTMAKRED